MRGAAYTRAMTRRQVTAWGILGLVVGGGGLSAVVLFVPPYAAGQRLSPTALLLFFAALFLFVASAGSLLALALHRRWPALAGGARRGNRKPIADPALRQGILAALVVVTLTALAAVRALDVAFVIVVVLLAGLVEAYAQARQ